MGREPKAVLAVVALGAAVVVAPLANRAAEIPTSGTSSRPPQPEAAQPLAGRGSSPTPVRPAADAPVAVAEGTPLVLSHDGSELWLLGFEGDFDKPTPLLRRWNAASGETRDVRVVAADPAEPNVLDNGVWATAFSGSFLSTPDGLLEVGGRGPGSSRILFIDTQGRAMGSRLEVPRSRPLLVLLRDGSVLALGGIAGMKGEQKIFSNAVERIVVAGGKPSATRLPDVPGPVRRGIAVVELADRRVLVVGGSSSPYVGSEPISAETYVLDPVAGTWQPGPKLLEPRTDASATLLPDGGVLVAGGWTPANNWNTSAARSVERWRPGGAAFTPDSPLAHGVAGHRALWMPGPGGRVLVVAAGWTAAWKENATVQTLDVSSGDWRLSGESCSADPKTGEVFVVPVAAGNRRWVWCQFDGRMGWSFVALRAPAAGSASTTRFDPEKGIALRRGGIAFLPARGGEPALAIGGNIDGVDVAAVDAVWQDGRTEALAPLNRARSNAQVLRLADGSILVAGGVHSKRSNNIEPSPAPELLLTGRNRWIDLAIEMQPATQFAPLVDGGVVAVGPDGSVEVLSFKALGSGKPKVNRRLLPALSRSWRAPAERTPGSVAVKALPDGRIVVAGGEAQVDRIAVFHNAIEDPAAPDRFVGYGPYLPARTFETYDPATKTWRESAPSHSAHGLVAILDDGRVVKWGHLPRGDTEPDAGRVRGALLEVSGAGGQAWRTFDGSEAPTVTVNLLREALPFVLDGELFLSGWHLTDVTPDHARGPRMLEWFDAAAHRWRTLWEAPENEWRDHLGRVLVRDLPGGRRVVVPVVETQ